MTGTQTICLCMIVKNEAPVIRRCLESLRSFIDYWVIVDTGSTDGTQGIIRDLYRNIPGALHERPWMDFAHNRTQALQLADGHGDYIFVIDADEMIELPAGWTKPYLEADTYLCAVRYGATSYVRKQLVRNGLPWRYVGVVHEYITCDQPGLTEAVLDGLVTVVHHEGARSRDPLTYRRDALVLETALLSEPENHRYVFYLAQSYKDAGESELAIKHYRRRIEMGAWVEEVWVSMYEIARQQDKMGLWSEAMESYLAAYQYQPARAEPLYNIGMHYQVQAKHQTSHVFLNRAMQIPKPGHERLFIEAAVYDYLLPLEYAVACYYLGRHEEAILVNERLLASGLLPDQLRDLVQRNIEFSKISTAPPPG